MKDFLFSEPTNPVLLTVSEENLVRLLLLRALFELGCTNNFLREHCFDHDQSAHFLGLQALVEDYDRKGAIKALKHKYTAARRAARKAWQLSNVLTDNLCTLQQLVGLDAVECKLLVFFSLMHSENILSHVCSNWLDDFSTQASFTSLAVLLEVSREDVARALSQRGKLVRCGLVSVEAGNSMSIRRRFDILSPSFSDRLLAQESTAEDLLIGAVKPGKSPTLIQDVFDDGGLFVRSTAEVRKAEVNALLEENPLPAFWLTNNARRMDNAFIRRFDIVIELDVPPLSRRREILEQTLEGLPVPAVVMKQFSQHERLSPAVMRRAASVVRAVHDTLADDEVPRVLETLFNETLQAQCHGRIQKSPANALPDFYDPTLVNADMDLAELAAGIAAHPSARICLYGPPGTGKSAFAQWLAEKLQRPFHSRRLSDILSMWVGGTEKNLRRVFDEAEQDNAVLLLDEVDSFLQDRRNAQRSWELTQVNEMLVQMEAFNGVFIASTNLMNNLDQAALRRFDLKVRLGYLKPEQAWTLFVSQASILGFCADATLQADVHAMPLLTPGDFAAVQRRHRFKPLANAAALLQGLRDECAVKEGAKTHRIGFV